MSEADRVDAMLRVTGDPHRHALAVMSMSACAGWARPGPVTGQRVADVLAWTSGCPDEWARDNYGKDGRCSTSTDGSPPSTAVPSATSSKAPTASATASSPTPLSAPSA